MSIAVGAASLLCSSCIQAFQPPSCVGRCRCFTPHLPRSGSLGFVSQWAQDCRFCSFIHDLLQIEPSLPSAGAAPASDVWTLDETISPWNIYRPWAKRKLYVLRLGNQVKAYLLALAQPDEKMIDHHWTLKRWTPSRPIDMTRIRRWMRLCQSSHSRCLQPR
jgi:hypothetical protein